MVTTNESFVEKNGLLLAKAVVQQNDNTVPLRVANFGDTPVKLYKNTVAGTFEPIKDGNVISVEESEKRPVNTVQVSNDVELPEHLIEVYEKGSEGLNEANKEQLKRFLYSYQDVFSKSSSDLGFTDQVVHKINTGETKPIKQRPYRLPLAKREAAMKEIESMAAKNIIEPSSSAWCSPVIMVQKSDGSVRFCCDFRRLNAASLVDCQPLPRIDDTLDALSGNCWFSTLDMRSGYWQCALEESDREKLPLPFQVVGYGNLRFCALG